jgi:predicted ATPase
MLLSKFELENFKSFLTRQELPLAPITLLYGPNGGGKSSVIQALLALRQTFACGSPRLILDGPLVQLGDFSSVVSRHEHDRDIVMAVTSGNIGLHLRHAGGSKRTIEIHYRYGQYAAEPREAELSEMTISWDGATSGRCTVNASPCDHVARAGSYAEARTYMASGTPYESTHKTLYCLDGDSRRSLRTLAVQGLEPEYERQLFKKFDEADFLERVQHHYIKMGPRGLPDFLCDSRNGPWRTEEDEYLPTGYSDDRPAFLQHVADCLKELCGNTVWHPPLLAYLSHIEPLRGTPEPLYRVDAPRGAVAYPLIGGWANWLFGSPDCVAFCNEWLHRLKTKYKLSVQEVVVTGTGGMFQLLLTDEHTGTAVTLADVGFGVSQMLPLFVHAHLLDQMGDGMVCVQQPELHLHPRLQGQLADFFIENTCTPAGDPFDQSTSGCQWLIETHSEALITRIQRRVREGKIAASDISVLYVEKLEDKGSIVTPLRLGEDGEFLDEWPGGFFEDGFDDIFGLDR